MSTKKPTLRLPVLSEGAEYLVMGYLMRRNILTYQAPRNFEAYDLICVHPDPTEGGKRIRIQVKSRYATDCDRGFPIKSKSFGGFDYVAVVFQNIGYYLQKRKSSETLDGLREPEIYIIPENVIRENHSVSGGWQKVNTRRIELGLYEGEAGVNLVAQDLGIAYPEKI